MLPNWSAYFDSKTSTQSFYEVDYRAIILKCGPSLYENLALKPATNISNSTLTEFKSQFQAMLKILKENITQQQPWKDIKKVSKVIDNVVAYVYIEGAYLKRVQMDATDLQVSPSFSFTIQRLVRLAKDLHLLCIYAKKKETEEFKETRRVLKEAMRSVRKSALHFLKEYSTKQEEQTIDPIREILMAQFLQLVKFLVNFTKFEDHQAYVTYCSSGSTTKNLPDIWKMTDVSVRQATNGASSIMMDSRKDIDNASNLSSLMRIPSQGRRGSVVSTVHELCSLGDLLVKKRDFTQGSTKSYNDYKGSIGDLEGVGESILGFGKQKGFRRRTADEQDRPDSRLLKETYKLYGNNTGGADGTKGPKRSNSITVPSQFSRNEQAHGGKEGSETNFVIEEQSGEASPKKCGSRKFDTDKIEEKPLNNLKILGQGKTEVEHHNDVVAEDKVPEDQEAHGVHEDNHKIKETEEENEISQKEQGTEIYNNTQEITLGVMGVVLPEEIFSTFGDNPGKNEATVTENTSVADGTIDNPQKEETPKRIAQFKRKLRAVSVGRNTLLQLVLKHEAPNVESLEVTPRNAMSIEGSPVVIARSEKRHNGEIETAGLPPPKQGSIIVETAALNIPRSRRESFSPVRKRRSSSLDGLPKRSQTRDKRPHRKSGGYKKPEEDFSFQPMPVMERRKQFLIQTFGAQNKVGVERSLQDSYGLFHQRYDRIYKERVYDIRRTTEFGKKRLACIPYVVPESLMFFEKVQEVRRQEAKEKSNKVTKGRILELWEKVRQAVKLKTFLWKLDCQKDMEFPTSTKKDNSDLLKSFTKNSKGHLKFFRYTTKDNKEVRYVGPVRNLREIKHKDLHNGSFIPEENRECEDEFYALETSLRLARLAFNRRSIWGAAFSFRGRGGPSVESRDFSRDASRDASRETSRENSGSGLSSTKRGSLLKTLFNTSAENSVILSPSNRSMSEGKEQSWSVSKSKPSLFKSLLRLHPVNEPSSASPRTTRSRASSKTSLKDCINNSCLSSPRGTSGPMSCPKKPSLFKTLFKLNTKDSDSQKSGRSSREPNTPASAGWKTSRD